MITEQINRDLQRIIEVRNIQGDTDSRIAKLEEEGCEFVEALLIGTLDDMSDEGADVMLSTAITLLQRGINPWAAMVKKLDKMNLETPFRKAERSGQ